MCVTQGCLCQAHARAFACFAWHTKTGVLHHLYVALSGLGLLVGWLVGAVSGCATTDNPNRSRPACNGQDCQTNRAERHRTAGHALSGRCSGAVAYLPVGYMVLNWPGEQPSPDTSGAMSRQHP
jgi:hypothetical protein